jgi:ABC-type phosphate/phosphonate transport system substrate-binding protein
VLAGNHFRLIEVPTAKDAVAAVVDKKADLALLWEGAWRAVKPRTEAGADLEAVHTSGTLPPSVFVSVGKHVRRPDRKAMAAAVDKVCKTTGGPACARVGILYIDARKDGYDEITRAYDVVR